MSQVSNQGWIQSKKSTIVRFILWNLFVFLVLSPETTTAANPTQRSPSPLTVTPEMRAWVESRVPAMGSPESRWRRLARELLLPADGRDFVETPLVTTTAAEAFTSRRANCVAFAHLAVALARELGLPAYFVLAKDVIDGHALEGQEIAEGHVAAGFGEPGNWTMLDLGGLQRPATGSTRRISDATARAIFYSNRGAEALLAGRPGAALEWLRTAVRLEPRLSRLWLNLGVAARRAGRPQAAIRAYRRALELEPTLARLNIPGTRR